MILFQEEKECCGCGACMNICPKNAITMQEDAAGFVFPKINPQNCIECGLCVRICNWKKELPPLWEQRKYYYASRKDTEQVLASTSGGIAAALTEKFLKEDGVVFGCTMKRENGVFQIFHAEADSLEKAEIFKGSKYVQSDTGWVYTTVKKRLSEGKKVLFIGTPCQVAGLKNFLNRDYDALFTIDLICHGIPSQAFFRAYISFLEEKKKWHIESISFRAKIKKIDASKHYYMRVQVKNRQKYLFSKLQSYYGYFLNGDSYRMSCYHCKYACENRVGDITLGDGWGILHTDPQALKENGGNIVNEYGVSSVLVNSPKGAQLFEQISQQIYCYETDFEKISRENHQLVHPTPYREFRKKLISEYQKKGYSHIDRLYFEHLDKKSYYTWKYYLPISNAFPHAVKQIVNKFIHG